MALGKGQDSDIQSVEADGIDRAQFAGARAGRRVQLQQFESESVRNEMRCLVQFGASAARGASGVISELHLAIPLSRIRLAASAASVLVLSNVLSGLILRRSSSRITRAMLASARNPCTRS